MPERVTRSVITGSAIPGRTGVTLLARLRTGTGQLVTRASISTIAYTVSNISLGTALGSGSFATTTIYDSLQQGDARWRADSAAQRGPDGEWGYNWAAELAATLFALTTLAAPGVISGPAKPQTIQADVVFTPVSGEPFRVVFTWQKLPVYG